MEAATRVFLEKGYRRTQMSDVAQALHVAQGTLYLYVESKEALFDTVMRFSVSPEFLNKLQLPIRTPPASTTLSFIRKAVTKGSRIASLDAALSLQHPHDGRAELKKIAEELYSKASGNWLALKLLDRSALDWPELAALWFGKYRLSILQQLSRYFEIRMGGGHLRKVPDPATAARLVLEIVAAFAIHCRLYESSAFGIAQDLAEVTAIDAIVNAYALPSQTRRRER